MAIGANHKAKDPHRQEAYRLSKLESIQAWRGKIVDKVISDTIIPSISWNRPITLEQAKAKADQLFHQEQMERANANIPFLTENDQPPTPAAFTTAHEDIHKALENLYRTEQVWTMLRQQAQRLVPQRALTFKHGDTSVRVVPDLIIFQNSKPPVILDWKVNTYAVRDYWLQLVTGAIALTRCNPHKDWPAGASNHEPHTIQLLEVQLLTGHTKGHTITQDNVQDAENHISISAEEMQLACNNDPKSVQPEDLASATEPRTCQWCNFKTICWRTAP